MPSTETEKSKINRRDAMPSAWNELRAQLQNEKDRIYQALATYPSPIAACDQQFNYLLEEQRRISRELARLNEVIDASLTSEDPGQLMEEFIRTSS